MATFRNDTGDDLTLDRFGLYVPAGSTFEIPDESADSLAGQAALVRVASDVEPDITIPAEIARDLVDEQAPAEPVEEQPAAADAAPEAADGTSEPADAAPTPADDAAGEPATAPAEQPAEQPAAVEEPSTEDDVDLDSFSQA